MIDPRELFELYMIEEKDKGFVRYAFRSHEPVVIDGYNRWPCYHIASDKGEEEAWNILKEKLEESVDSIKLK